MVSIQFKYYGQEDRFGESFGPFPFIQATYDSIWAGEEGGERIIAYFEDRLWITEDGQKWSDFIISTYQPGGARL